MVVIRKTKRKRKREMTRERNRRLLRQRSLRLLVLQIPAILHAQFLAESRRGLPHPSPQQSIHLAIAAAGHLEATEIEELNNSREQDHNGRPVSIALGRLLPWIKEGTSLIG